MDGKQQPPFAGKMTSRHLPDCIPVKRLWPGKTFPLLMALVICFIFLSACKPKTVPDSATMKAEIAQEFAKADKGDAAARFNIGLMYFRGEGVPQDYRQARVWFEKAAMQGLGEAQYNLGAMLEQGLGVEKNAATAKNWYEKAAAQGIGEAQYSLANLYLFGQGTSQNLDKASEWMQKAAAHGIMAARERLSILLCNDSGSFEPAKIRSWLGQSSRSGGEKVKILQEKIRDKS